MNKESIIFLTKDAFCKDYLPVYGNKYWEGKTPNIDELAREGTVFANHYSAAPSSAMSYLSMFTNQFCHTLENKIYQHVKEDYSGVTVFDRAFHNGFECHVLWEKKWQDVWYHYTRCYGKHTIFHPVVNIRQSVGLDGIRDEPVKPDKQSEKETLKILDAELNRITQSGNKVFLWAHMPHVLKGRTGYGSDIDMFDNLVGIVRKYFDDSNIFISADHGNMNGCKGKLRYGFDVYESSIHIPLIAPKIKNMSVCQNRTTSVDIYDIIFNRDIPERDVIYADSAYYRQITRKLAILKGRYKYIYNRETNTEELYDLIWDPNENFNIISDYHYDRDRNMIYPSCELYFYPFWDRLPGIRSDMRNEKNKIWREGTKLQIFESKLKRDLKLMINKIRYHKGRKQLK